MGTSTFSGPVVSNNGFTGDLTGGVQVPTHTVENAPSASAAGAGTIIYVTDGASGSPILAFSDGTDWKRSDTGATISAT